MPEPMCDMTYCATTPNVAYWRAVFFCGCAVACCTLCAKAVREEAASYEDVVFPARCDLCGTKITGPLRDVVKVEAL